MNELGLWLAPLTLAAIFLLERWQQERFSKQAWKEFWAREAEAYRVESEYYSLMVSCGAMTINEVRQFQNAWDALLSGQKHRTLWLPQGSKVTPFGSGSKLSVTKL